MDDEQKQELLNLWRMKPYLKYYEALRLLTGTFPKTDIIFAEKDSEGERYELINQILEHDIGQFKLKVYFEEMYDGNCGIRPLYIPEYAEKYDELQYYVQPEENFACFWLFGKLSAQELKTWLQDKGISSSFFETTASPISDSSNAKLPGHSDTSVATVNEISPQNVPDTPVDHLDSSVDMQQVRIPIKIPTSLWAGKTPQTIFDALSDKDFVPEIIAYILMNKAGGVTKTYAGRLFYQEDTNKGIEHEPKTYQRKINDLLEVANSKYLFTFEE